MPRAVPGMPGFQGEHTVQEFLSTCKRGSDRHILSLAIRRPSPKAPYRWTAVRGLPCLLKADPSWNSFKFFSYRSGQVVFIVEQETGLHVALGASIERAKKFLLRALADITPEEFSRRLAVMLTAVNVGPKPRVTLKTWTPPKNPDMQTNSAGSQP